MVNLDELMSGAKDAMTARRVYGEPIEKDGATFIPAAVVLGGGGGGEGDQGEDQPAGSGGGFGIVARPVGAYRISEGEVTWIPAPDVTRIAMMAQLVLVVALLVARSILRRGDQA